MKPALSLGKDLLTGLVGGLVATGVKTVCELISPPRAPGVPSPLANALDAVSHGLTGHDLTAATKTYAEPAVHFGFGIAAGGVYALLARRYPIVRAGYGSLFGVAFWLSAHEIALPLMGLSPSPAAMTRWEQGNEFVSHIIFGIALEATRRFMARGLA